MRCVSVVPSEALGRCRWSTPRSSQVADARPGRPVAPLITDVVVAGASRNRPRPNPDRGLPNSEASWSVVPFAVQRGTLLNSGDEGRCRADDPKRALEKFRF